MYYESIRLGLCDPDFAMTYLRFFLVNEHGSRHVVQIDNRLCFCLVADADDRRNSATSLHALNRSIKIT
jgi:hypothetical protein